MGGGAGKPAKQDASSGGAVDSGMLTGSVGLPTSQKPAGQGNMKKSQFQSAEVTEEEEKLDIPDYIDILQENTDDVVRGGGVWWID